MDSRISLGDIISWMVDSSRADFFARLLMGISTRKERLAGAAMALALLDGKYVVLWDPEYLKQATLDHVIFVLYHEMHHFILEHIPRQLRLAVMYRSRGEEDIFNLVTPLAVDLAVNQEVVRHPRTGNIYDTIRYQPMAPIMPGVPPFEEVPSGKSYEWYVEFLADVIRKKRECLKKTLDWLSEQRNNLSGKSKDYLRGFIDGISQAVQDRQINKDKNKKPPENKNPDYNKGYAEGYAQGKGAPSNADSLIKTLIQDQTLVDIDSLSTDDLLLLANELENSGRCTISKAVNDHKSRGTIPAYLKEYIEDILQQPRIPWTKILRNRVINTQRYKRYRSLGRPRRRHLGIPRLMKFPGYSKERKFKVAFCIDTSGSMGTKELQQGLGELQGLQKADKDIEIHVIECDAKVGKVYKIGPYDEIQRKVTGRGGTSFDPAVIKAKELKPDIVIYFTDGYAPPLKPENRVACPFIWVITPGGRNPDPDYGFVITTRE